MTEINESLEDRKLTKIISKLKVYSKAHSPDDTLIVTSSDDKGVQRNGGRAGARFAPKTITHELGKFEAPQNISLIKTVELCSEIKKKSFNDIQIESKDKLSTLLKSNFKSLIHLGGGHDHIYPLLMAIQEDERYERCLIINIDAHTDTRVEEFSHSGTPFRQFDKNSNKTFSLLQLGVRLATNNKKNFSELNTGSMHCLPFYKDNDLEPALEFINEHKQGGTAIILSIDCDGIDLADLPSVSAPNPYGTPFKLLIDLVNKIKHEVKFLGVYELNPLMDEHSNLSSKKVAWILYNYLNGD